MPDPIGIPYRPCSSCGWRFHPADLDESDRCPECVHPEDEA